MNKEFANYQQALKLKELGFDEECIKYQYKSENPSKESILKNLTDEDYIGIPLKSQAFRWFREKHNIPFEIVCDNDYGLGYIRGYYPKIAVDSKNKTEPVYQNKDCFETYEEAELACLDKLIEIIETNQNK